MKNIFLSRINGLNVLKYYEKCISLRKNDKLLIQNLSGGICGTDMDILHSSRSDSAKILGHECIGKILEKNDSGNEFSVNDIVVYSPVSPIDQNRVLGHSYDGIFSKYRTISSEDLKHSLLFKIGKNYEDWYGAILEPLSVSIYAMEIVSRHIPGKNALIIGTGAIAHVLGFFLISKGYFVKMVTHSTERLESLVNHKNDISYSDINTLFQKKISYDFIFCCSPRRRAVSDFNLAVNIASSETVIDLINGFTEEVFVHVLNKKQIKPISLSDIRRKNFCGIKRSVFQAISPKIFYITGHRGSSEDHLKFAEREILENKSHYKKLINKRLKFEDLGNFFNSGCKLPLNHFGKIAIDF